MNTNKAEITQFLISISECYRKLGDVHRASTFRSVSGIINENWDGDTITKGELLSDLSGIGPSTVKEVNQFIETGTSDRYEKIKEKGENVGSKREEKLNDALNVIKGLRGK